MSYQLLTHFKTLPGTNKSCSLVFCALLLPFLSVYAQVPQAIETEETNVDGIRALAVGFEGDLRTLHLLDANRQSAGTIRLMLRSYSHPFEAPIVDGRIIFGVEAGVDEENEPVYRPIGSVPWSRSFSDRALVFIPKSFMNQPGMDQPYLIRMINLAEKDFKRGSTKIINFTPITGYVRFGEHRAAIEAGKSTTFPEITEVLPYNMAELAVYYRANDEAKAVLDTRMRYLDGSRYLFILYPDLKNQRVGFASIRGQ
mgnify:CR=1 FL=1